jgi:para-aminobenzoate synthetase/4-amino-4-deoxychorismate lyase
VKTAYCRAIDGRWLCFSQPLATFSTTHSAEVLPLLRAVFAQAEQRRCYAVGWLSYEAAAGFDSAYVTHAADDFPLLWFGLFGQTERAPPPPSPAGKTALDWQAAIDKSTYLAHIARIKHYIRAGDTYQVNYTFPLYAKGNEARFLVPQGRYGACLEGHDFSIYSASPELFLHWRDGDIITRPMKGTAPRLADNQKDAQQAELLRESAKNRAENLMIVDMLRNDLGRIAIPGTVQVPTLFDIEAHPSVWQMTSCIRAQTHAPLAEVFHALFPCASITGAPKVRTMQIIHELETAPRRIYTGSIGFYAPQAKEAQFNVAIRTALADHRLEQLSYHVGGGIVWDSDAEDEYQECWLKARILKNYSCQ